MSLELKAGERNTQVDIISKNGNSATVSVDGKKYHVDIVMVEEGVYSIIHNGISYNVELIENGSSKKYTVNTLYKSYDIEIIDAEAKYLKNRKQAMGDESRTISSPMPGKVVKILVKKGDHVKGGETVVIVSAMKMESEYKVQKDRVVKDILVKEGDTVNSNQPLIIVE